MKTTVTITRETAQTVLHLAKTNPDKYGSDNDAIAELESVLKEGD